MRVLITNDDGIHAQGLAVLEKIALAIADEVWICAPETEQSGAARSLTLAEPIRVRQLEPRRFAVRGTPTDCVMLAVETLMRGDRPDLVLSGVNRGLNAAEDVTLSGTVAGAIEAMAMGIPGIALSQMMSGYGPDCRVDFEPAEQLGPDLVARLIAAGWPRDVVINVNFPLGPASRVTGVEVTRQGFRDVRTRFAERRTDLRGRDYYLLGHHATPSKPAEGTDLRAAYDGRVSVTPLHIDLTHEGALQRLRSALCEAPARVEATAR
jgi:5'-nucleotidase